MGEISEFGVYWKELRMGAGMSQRDIAMMCDISHTYVSKIEHDSVEPPSEKTIRAFHSVVGGDLEKLFTLAGKQKQAGLCYIQERLTVPVKEMSALYAAHKSGDPILIPAGQLMFWLSHIRQAFERATEAI